MKKRILALGCMAALLAFGSEAFAAEGTATATIGGALSISQTVGGTGTGPNGNLAFGYIIPSGTSGTVTIATDGVKTSTGGVTTTGALTAGAANFTVTGVAGAKFNIGLPNDTTVILTGPGTAMAVTAFSHSGADTVGLLGTQTFTVGGTLAVAASQAPGAYEGTFNVTAVYQ
jgi:Mat/Ecp fimbriae major subunit